MPRNLWKRCVSNNEKRFCNQQVILCWNVHQAKIDIEMDHTTTFSSSQTLAMLCFSLPLHHFTCCCFCFCFVFCELMLNLVKFTFIVSKTSQQVGCNRTVREVDRPFRVHRKWRFWLSTAKNWNEIHYLCLFKIENNKKKRERKKLFLVQRRKKRLDEFLNRIAEWKDCFLCV